MVGVYIVMCNDCFYNMHKLYYVFFHVSGGNKKNDTMDFYFYLCVINTCINEGSGHELANW